jgi:integrase
MTGVPLAPDQNPIPARMAARADAIARACRLFMDERYTRLGAQDPALDGDAVGALATVFGKCANDAKDAEGAELLSKRLENWYYENAARGEWVQLFGMWAEASIHDVKHVHGVPTDADAPAGYAVQMQPPSGLKALTPTSVSRYVTALARRWLLCMDGFTPADAVADPEAFVERVGRLEFASADVTARSPVFAAVQRFLRFFHAQGGPHVAYRGRQLPTLARSQPDANLLAPWEYTLLLSHLGDPEGSFDVARCRAAAILAWRLGPRIGEIEHLQFADLQMTPEVVPRGVLHTQPNRFHQGKTRNARRRLALEEFLTPDERIEAARFLERPRHVTGIRRKSTDFVFASPAAPDVPPSSAELHDPIQAGMRAVSGDGSLVFHHLRHSAANFVFWRLFMEDGGLLASSWFVGGTIVESTALGIDAGAYMDALTRRRAADPSRLYVLSRVLGHLGPGTALASYVHLVEFVLARYTAEGEGLDRRQVAAINGVSHRSQRKQDYRAHRRIRGKQ